MDIDTETYEAPLAVAEKLCESQGWDYCAVESGDGFCAEIEGHAADYSFWFLWNKDNELFTVCCSFPLKVEEGRRIILRSLLCEVAAVARIGRFELPPNEQSCVFRHTLPTHDVGITMGHIASVRRYIFDYCEATIPIIRAVAEGKMQSEEAMQIIEMDTEGEA